MQKLTFSKFERIFKDPNQAQTQFIRIQLVTSKIIYVWLIIFYYKYKISTNEAILSRSTSIIVEL